MYIIAQAYLLCCGVQIFNGAGGQEGRTTSPRQISFKSAQTRPRYRDLSIFQDGGRRHLGFKKKSNF